MNTILDSAESFNHSGEVSHACKIRNQIQDLLDLPTQEEELKELQTLFEAFHGAQQIPNRLISSLRFYFDADTFKPSYEEIRQFYDEYLTTTEKKITGGIFSRLPDLFVHKREKFAPVISKIHSHSLMLPPLQERFFEDHGEDLTRSLYPANLSRAKSLKMGLSKLLKRKEKNSQKLREITSLELTIDEAITNQEGLKDLFLSLNSLSQLLLKNPLGGVNADFLSLTQHLPHLRMLDFDEFDFTKTLKNGLGVPGGLKILCDSDSDITSLSPSEISSLYKNCFRVKKLKLTKKKLGNLSLDQLRALFLCFPNLEHLFLCQDPTLGRFYEKLSTLFSSSETPLKNVEHISFSEGSTPQLEKIYQCLTAFPNLKYITVFSLYEGRSLKEIAYIQSENIIVIDGLHDEKM